MVFLPLFLNIENNLLQTLHYKSDLKLSYLKLNDKNTYNPRVKTYYLRFLTFKRDISRGLLRPHGDLCHTLVQARVRRFRPMHHEATSSICQHALLIAWHRAQRLPVLSPHHGWQGVTFHPALDNQLIRSTLVVVWRIISGIQLINTNYEPTQQLQWMNISWYIRNPAFQMGLKFLLCW